MTTQSLLVFVFCLLFAGGVVLIALGLLTRSTALITGGIIMLLLFVSIIIFLYRIVS